MSNYYLGIDVSKGYSDFIMLDQFKHPVDTGFQLDDTAEGHRMLAAYLTQFFKTYPAVEIFSAVESTGGYENNWYRSLIELSENFVLQVARLNPARVKFNSDASAKRNKTDAISAKDVAEYLISHPEKVDYRTADKRFPMLRRQWNFIRLNVKQQTQLLNHLQSVLYVAMPEILNFCRHGIPNWLLRVLQRHPTYDALKEAGVEELSRMSYVSGRKADALLTLLHHGIGDSNDISGQIISIIAAQALALEDQIKQLKKLLAKNYQEAKEQVEIITSCNGFGVYSAVGLLMNMPPMETLNNVKQLASYWGAHPVYKQSGDGSWAFRMSKQGRSEPRAILYMAAWSAIQHNPIIKELYARCIAKKMHPNAALGVCMHKLLRIVYGMLKNQTPFDPEVDRTNQANYHTASTKPRVTRPMKRRLQNFDKNAPISNRQHKKRKKQTQSQDEYLAQCGIESLSLPNCEGDDIGDKPTAPRATSSIAGAAGARE